MFRQHRKGRLIPKEYPVNVIVPRLKIYIMAGTEQQAADFGYTISTEPGVGPEGELIKCYYLQLSGMLPERLPKEVLDIAVRFNYSCEVKESSYRIGDDLHTAPGARFFHTGKYLEAVGYNYAGFAATIRAFLSAINDWQEEVDRVARNGQRVMEHLGTALNEVRPVLRDHTQALTNHRTH